MGEKKIVIKKVFFHLKGFKHSLSRLYDFLRDLLLIFVMISSDRCDGARVMNKILVSGIIRSVG